jgi:uncharacterized membrane protein
MSSRTGGGRPNRQLPTRRLEALVDGVCAIAITLLAIEITVPIVDSTRSGDLVRALLDQWPSYVAYTVTFFIVGAYWINHHRLFFLLRGVDHAFLILNIFYLMAIAIIPFPNAVLAEYLTNPSLRGVAAAVYGLSMLVLAALFNATWWCAYVRGLFRPDVDRLQIRSVLRSFVAGPVIFLVALALSAWVPTVSLIIYLTVPFGYLFEGPVGKIEEGYLAAGV